MRGGGGKSAWYGFALVLAGVMFGGVAMNDDLVVSHLLKFPCSDK